MLVVLVLLWYRGDSGFDGRFHHRPRTRARGAERRRKNNEKKWKRKEEMSRRNPDHCHRCPPQEEARSPQLTFRRSYGRLSCILHSQSSLSFSFSTRVERRETSSFFIFVVVVVEAKETEKRGAFSSFFFLLFPQHETIN